MLHNIFFIFFCIITITPLMSMEQYNQLNKNLTLDNLQSYEDIYLQHYPENHKNIWSHITSNLDASTKNILSETCPALKKITSRNNPEIYLHSTLSTLSQREKNYGLFLAIYKNMLHIVENLLKNGASPNAPNPFNISLLEFAQHNNAKENHLITSLKEHSAVLNNAIPSCILDAYCNTTVLSNSIPPYMLDAYFGTIEKHINDKTINWSRELPISRYNALELAAVNNQARVVKILLVKKARLSKSAIYRSFPKIIKYPYIIELLCPYFPLDVINSLLFDCVKKNHVGTFRLLINQCPDYYINHIDDDCNTFLMHASLEGHTEVAQLILKQSKRKINYHGKDSNTALMIASTKGHTEIVQLLLQQPELSINEINNQQNTALTCASYNGHIEIVKPLLQHSELDVNHKNAQGDTALTIAKRKGHHEIVEMLKQHGAKEECTIL